MTNAETIKAIDAEIKIQEAELQRLREEKAAIVQEENHVDKLFDAVLECPHSITHESVTLHFYPRQKEGHNALAQLHHRLAAYDQAARQREMQLLSEIEALERVALNALKQLGADTAPIAWYVTGCSTMLDEHEAKVEAKRCGGSAKAVPLYTRPAEGVPAQIETLRAELAEEIEAAENWRRLALQFDNHRLQALGHLKAILHQDSSVDEYKTAELFLKAPPLDGESVLAQRIAELSATTQAQADAQDTDRWMGIGKAIQRACADLPEETEIIVSLEKGAGTVTLIDQDGNEHKNFSTDYGFAGVLNEAIDTAIAAQAKN